MKLKGLLAVSIGLNAGLLAAVVFLFKCRPAPDHTTAKPSASTSNTSAKETAKGGVVATNKVMQPFDWRMVESADYKQYIANLRSIGCPEETIRDIIIADVNKLFESRVQEAAQPKEQFKFWKTGMSSMIGGMFDAEKIKKRQALAEEKRALLKELLGVEVEESKPVFGGLNPFEDMLGFLSADKQRQIRQLEEKFTAKQMDLFKDSFSGTDSLADMKKMMEEKQAELAKILTPEELENYQLLLSPTAMVMRIELDGFDPTEQEFRELFKIREKYQGDFGMFGMLGSEDSLEDANPSAGAKLADAQQKMNEEIRKLLGDERYADYQRSSDWEYKAVARVIEKNGLPKATANQVHEMQKIAEQKKQEVRNDASLSGNQRAAALKAIEDETDRSIRATLGDKAYEAYKKRDANVFIQSIKVGP